MQRISKIGAYKLVGIKGMAKEGSSNEFRIKVVLICLFVKVSRGRSTGRNEKGGECKEEKSM